MLLPLTYAAAAAAAWTYDQNGGIENCHSNGLFGQLLIGKFLNVVGDSGIKGNALKTPLLRCLIDLDLESKRLPFISNNLISSLRLLNVEKTSLNWSKRTGEAYDFM